MNYITLVDGIKLASVPIYTMYNQLHIIKPSAGVSMRDVIGYFHCEIDSNVCS